MIPLCSGSLKSLFHTYLQPSEGAYEKFAGSADDSQPGLTAALVTSAQLG